MRRRSRYGWLELIEGILLILLGIITLFRPGNVLKGITIAYGIMAVITGISDIVFYAKTERYTGFGPTISLVSGILSILAGLMLLMYPNAGELVLVLLLPIWFIAHSISRLLLLYNDLEYCRSHSWLSDDPVAVHCIVLSRIYCRNLPDPPWN